MTVFSAFYRIKFLYFSLHLYKRTQGKGVLRTREAVDRLVPAPPLWSAELHTDHAPKQSYRCRPASDGASRHKIKCILFYNCQIKQSPNPLKLRVPRKQGRLLEPQTDTRPALGHPLLTPRGTSLTWPFRTQEDGGRAGGPYACLVPQIQLDNCQIILNTPEMELKTCRTNSMVQRREDTASKKVCVDFISYSLICVDCIDGRHHEGDPSVGVTREHTAGSSHGGVLNHLFLHRDQG
ncbi:uncharacterized protein LOC144222219 [Crocuta crocuta]